MNTPRKTKLYNELAKDYQPKQAAMLMCQYMEGLEKRIADLESKIKKTETNGKLANKEGE